MNQESKDQVGSARPHRPDPPAVKQTEPTCLPRYEDQLQSSTPHPAASIPGMGPPNEILVPSDHEHSSPSWHKKTATAGHDENPFNSPQASAGYDEFKILPNYKDQVNRVTRRPKPNPVVIAPERSEQSVSVGNNSDGISAGNHSQDIHTLDNEEEEREASTFFGFPVAEVLPAGDSSSERLRDLNLSSRAIVEMRENQRLRRRWIASIALLFCALAIILTLVIVCRNGQCFQKDKEPPVTSAPIQVTISPGTCDQTVSFSMLAFLSRSFI